MIPEPREFEHWVNERFLDMEYMYGNWLYEFGVLMMYLGLVLVANTYGAARYQFTGEIPCIDNKLGLH